MNMTQQEEGIEEKLPCESCGQLFSFFTLHRHQVNCTVHVVYSLSCLYMYRWPAPYTHPPNSDSNPSVVGRRINRH